MRGLGGTPRRRLAIGVAIAVAAVVAGALAAYLMSPTQRAFRAAGDIGQRMGEGFGAGAAAVLDVASDLREPYRCGFIEPLDSAAAEPATQAVGREFTRRGWRLDVSEPSTGSSTPGLTVGVIADTHGDLTHVSEIARSFADAKVELVVSLGGHGTTADDVTPVLAALASERWPVLALPGATEAVPEHRAAVGAARARAPGPILDGGDVRLLVMDGVAIATAPGAGHANQLEAGAEGCVPSPRSIAVLAAALANHPGPRVVASYSPPTGDTSSNLTLGGVRLGDANVASLVERGRASLVLHGLVAEAAPTENGRAEANAAAPTVLSAGAASGLPVRLLDGSMARGAAVVALVSGGRVSYRPVRSRAPR